MDIMQPSLFSWQDIEDSPDIVRLRRTLEALDASELIAALEAKRKGKRDDYPVRAVWNSLIASLLFNHAGIADLIRELRRNAELRHVCGFDPLRGDRAVPPPWIYSRFLLKLSAHQNLLERIFQKQLERLGKLLPDLGAHLAADGKALPVPGRGDADATEGVKTETTGENKVIKRWFGYKLHMLCDAIHEMPLAFKVTPAHENESPHLMPLVESLRENQPELADRGRTLAADRGFDDGADKAALHADHGLLPIIPARDLAGGVYQPLDPSRHDAIYVSPTGEVVCRIDPFAPDHEKQFCSMQYQGFESDRQSLKFRCPAAASGVECKNQAACASRTKDQGFGRVARVRTDLDPRLHLPLYAHSQSFADAYKRRTSVERLFYRMDHFYGFERLGLRGLKKVTVRVTLALCAMLATAIGWIELGQSENMRRKFQLAA
jgi:hypothetical protein